MAFDNLNNFGGIGSSGKRALQSLLGPSFDTTNPGLASQQAPITMQNVSNPAGAWGGTPWSLGAGSVVPEQPAGLNVDVSQPDMQFVPQAGAAPRPENVDLPNQALFQAAVGGGQGGGGQGGGGQGGGGVGGQQFWLPKPMGGGGGLWNPAANWMIGNAFGGGMTMMPYRDPRTGQVGYRPVQNPSFAQGLANQINRGFDDFASNWQQGWRQMRDYDIQKRQAQAQANAVAGKNAFLKGILQAIPGIFGAGAGGGGGWGGVPWREGAGPQGPWRIGAEPPSRQQIMSAGRRMRRRTPGVAGQIGGVRPGPAAGDLAQLTGDVGRSLGAQVSNQFEREMIPQSAQFGLAADTARRNQDLALMQLAMGMAGRDQRRRQAMLDSLLGLANRV